MIGPTAAGKTQLLYLLTGLLRPDVGTRRRSTARRSTTMKRSRCTLKSDSYSRTSIIFNLTLRENIAFSKTVSDEDLREGDRYRRARRISSTLCPRSSIPSSPNVDRACRAARSSASCWLGPWRSIRRSCCSTTSRPAWTPPPNKRSWRTSQKNYPGITLVSVTQKIACRRALRPDRAADGGRGARHGYARAAHGNVSRVRPDRKNRNAAPPPMNYTLNERR